MISLKETTQQRHFSETPLCFNNNNCVKFIICYYIWNSEIEQTVPHIIYCEY